MKVRADNYDDGTRRRKRRVRKQRRAGQPLAVRIRWWINAAVAVLALIYCVGAVQHLSALHNQAGALTIGDHAGELRYALGEPTDTENGGSRWVYRKLNSVLTLDFDAAQRLAAFQCKALISKSGVCPTPEGVDIAATEKEIYAAFGWPTTVRYAGERKVLDYTSAGYSFQMSHGQLQAIIHTSPALAMTDWRGLFWLLVP